MYQKDVGGEHGKKQAKFHDDAKLMSNEWIVL
jgi:hypothetical protein